jgi:8-oxo-dGTP pyrophosphatase MutT (NUDIX family)
MDEPLSQDMDTPVERSVVVGTSAFWDRQNRRREVCMVLRRKSGLFLSFTKTFYPPGVYRLLTGGVEPGESVRHALLREVREETGLQVTVSRFLSVVAYHPEDSVSNDGGLPHYRTFVFLLDEVGGTLGALDQTEQVLAYREIPVNELPAIADTLDQLPTTFSPELGETWREWGRFRAIVHREVWRLLRSQRPEDVVD